MQIDKIVIRHECLCGQHIADVETMPDKFEESCMHGHYIFVSLKGDTLTLLDKIDGCASCPQTSLE